MHITTYGNNLIQLTRLGFVNCYTIKGQELGI
jgi:hypothetical protein